MESKKDIFGIVSTIILFILITIAGYISYKSIDWDVLKRIENQKLILPTPVISSPSANISTASATPSSLKK